MAKSRSDHITSCTIFQEYKDDILSVVTKLVQTEIQVRFYCGDNLISGKIFPMSEQQKQKLYSVLYKCINDWGDDDYSIDGLGSNYWQIKICAKGRCLRKVCGTVEPPPYGAEIKEVVAEIIGEENCYFF